MTVIAVALTFASGAMDVASFTRLGNVFTSVMTGNIVLWGLAVARGSLALASHTAVAVVGYVAGVAAGSGIAVGAGGTRAWGGRGTSGKGTSGKDTDGKGTDGKRTGGKRTGGKGKDGKDADGKDADGKDTDGKDTDGKRTGGKGKDGKDADGKGTDGKGTDANARAGRGGAGTWPAHITLALFAELALLSGFAAGWEITGARPGGWVQFCLLAIAAAGMGIQSSAVNHMGLTQVSTTFLTGTLTGLVSSLVSHGSGVPDRWRRLGVLLGLTAGASLAGLLVATAPDGVPALPLAALVTAGVLAWRPPRTERDRGSLAPKARRLGPAG